MTIKPYLVIVLLCALILPDAASAGTSETIIFLHPSTGSDAYSGGIVEEWFDNYSQIHGTSYDISERSHPIFLSQLSLRLSDHLGQWHSDSGQPKIECMNTLTAAYDVIIFKHCNSGADILKDTDTADITLSRKSLENYPPPSKCCHLHDFD